MAEFEIQPLSSTAESPPVSPRARGHKAERPKSDEKQVEEQNRTPEKDSAKAVDKSVENRRKRVVAEELMRHVSFSVNQEMGQVTVEVIDDETKEVIRQIPMQEAIKFRNKIEELLGTFVDREA